MLTMRQLELIEALFEIEPTSSYPQRAAAAVAELASAAGYRLVWTGSEVRHQAGAGEGLVALLVAGDRSLGRLHLYAADGTGRLGDERTRLARWAARLMARGLELARRANDGKHGVDVEALLDDAPLTPREKDVVGKLVAGASTRDIAQSTGLTVSTVNTYLKRIFAKLGVHSRVELLARVTGTHAAARAAPN